MSPARDLTTDGQLASVDAQDYLNLHRVEREAARHIYVATPLDRRTGGTVLRQQIRALNLGYAFYEYCTAAKEKSLQLPSVAIIGGGFAGITLAAGLLRRGFEVHLFEQRPELCHLQSGCEIRALHPTIYDWPHPASTRRDARLPILNWSAGTAGDVARSVLKQFENISENADGRYNEYLRANARIDGKRVAWDNAAEPSQVVRGKRWLGRGGSHEFDNVFVAVGFGIEADVLDATTVSYWRNDRFGQPRPGARSERPESILIAGTGDGALIDLIRTCVRGYKQDALIEDLFGDFPRLVARLGQLREKLIATPKASVLASVRAICNEPGLRAEADAVMDMIRRRRRHDTHVVLNGRAHSLDEQLTLQGRSFLNVLAASLLYDVEAFSYVGGEIDKTDLSLDGSVSIKGYGKLWPDEAIIRHGTDRLAILKATGLTGDDVESLDQRQRNAPDLWQLQSHWPPGWWSKTPESTRADDPKHWTERVPRTELLAGTILVKSACSSIDASGALAGFPYRTALHRVLHYASRGNLACYQQVTAYYGTAGASRMEGRVGRVFRSSADHKPGAVGVTIGTGKGFVAHQGSSIEQWNGMWNLLIRTPENHATGPHHSMQVDKVAMVVTVPISFTGSDGTTVRYVFYIDVEKNQVGDAPNQSAVKKAAVSAANTFGDSVESLFATNLDDGRLFSRTIAAPQETAAMPIGLAGEFSNIESDYGAIVSLFEVDPISIDGGLPEPLELSLPN
ncbi:NAD(P)-binding protein [Aeoliella sp.]|uniref:NAD(P)-binding protein n=1 Tax=Aeoliella sp. TaxID=2795800 RepID=UPI003CCBC034